MTTRLSMVVVAMLLLLIAFACKTNQTSSSNAGDSRPPASATPDQFAEVRGGYDKLCVNCHGKTGEGGPVKLEDGTKLKVPSLREGRAVRHDDAEYLKQITKGGDGMPAFEDKMSPESMSGLIKMIRVEFQGQ